MAVSAAVSMRRAYEDLPSMTVSQGQTRVSDQMWEAVCAAQKTGLSVVSETGVGLLDGGIQSKCWC